MAKKKNLKQLREEQKAARMSKIQASVKKKPETVPNAPAAVTDKKRDRKSQKTLAKASGLKSTLAVENSAVLTVFGRGNDAKLDHRIDKDLKTEALSSQTALKNVHAPNEQKIQFSGRLQDRILTADHPTHSHDGERAVGADLLCVKDKLEERYFGKCFNGKPDHQPADNIHIQLIYQILDIQKILALHSNNIIFTLDNLLHKDTEEFKDFVGNGNMRATRTLADFRESTNSSDQNAYQEFESFIKRKELMYFGSAFYNGDTRRDPNVIYHILALMSSVRQFCFHSDNTPDDGRELIKADWLYRLDENLTDELKSTLDALYQEAIERLDRNFLSDNTVNIQILCSIFN